MKFFQSHFHYAGIVTIEYKISSLKRVICAKDHNMMDDKIIELEMTLAHQDQQITELNDVVTEQWKHIEVLRTRLDKALAKLDQIGQGREDGAADGLSSIDRAALDRPPHY